MFLLEYTSEGALDKITPDAPYGLIGAYVNSLPLSIEVMLEQETIEEIQEDGLTKYKFIGGNE